MRANPDYAKQEPRAVVRPAKVGGEVKGYYGLLDLASLGCRITEDCESPEQAGRALAGLIDTFAPESLRETLKQGLPS